MATPKQERPMLGVEDRVTIAYITTLLAEMDLRYQQRFDAANKAVEAAFMAQQTAMQTALTAAEKAVQSALSAAEKAVTKAEVAAEKRFDGVNEFRKAYQDIIALQMPRMSSNSSGQSLASISMSARRWVGRASSGLRRKKITTTPAAASPK